VLTACDGTAVRKGGPGDAKSGAVLARTSDIPVGSGGLINSGSNGLLLIDQPTAGQFRAFNPTCPHAGAIVQAPRNGVITCPAHGSQFNAATGALRQGPAPNGLATVAIKVVGQNVVLA